MKKLIAMILAVGMMAMMSVAAFAVESTAVYNTPAEIVAGLTGRTVESVIAERAESGKTYGTIANDAGLLDEFKAECLKMKKDVLAEQVTNGMLTQEEADSIIAAIEANQAICDGTGTAGIGRANGSGFAGGAGFGGGAGYCGGRGQGGGGRGQGGGGRGLGIGGQRRQDGSCYIVN